MNMPSFVTRDEIELPDTPPNDIDLLITLATSAVLHATRRATYSVNDDGLPVSMTLRTAMKNAVIAQATGLHAAGLLPDIKAGGVTVAPSVKSASNNGSTIQYDTSGADMARNNLLAGGLVLPAHAYLATVGLLTVSQPKVLR